MTEARESRSDFSIYQSDLISLTGMLSIKAAGLKKKITSNVEFLRVLSKDHTAFELYMKGALLACALL
jgi:hypothetical protein